MTTKLCTPIIGGPLTALSTMVHVSKCEPGATVVVRSLSRPDAVIKRNVSTVDGWLTLDPGRSLSAGDRLVASQRNAAGEQSGETPSALAEVVGAAPTGAAGLGAVDILGRLWGCGRYVFVAGAVPGATAEVAWNGIVHGSGVAHGSEARFALDQGLPQGGKVQVRQRINAAGGPVLNRDVSPLPFPRDRPVPPPVILGPIRDCQTAVRVEGVFEGSDVILTRKSGEQHVAPFDLSGLWFNLPRPLDTADGWMTVRQEMNQTCELRGEESAPPVDIGPATKPRTPIVGPICAGSVRLQIDNLEAGAEVHITVGPDVYKARFSASGGHQFEVEPLPAGSISVQQFLCGVPSDVTTASVDPQPATLPTPKIVGPLWRCKRSVDMTDLYPGSLVQVWAKNGALGAAPISLRHLATATSMSIGVSPFLREDDTVWVEEWACALVVLRSAAEHVGALPPLRDPVLSEPITRLTTAVTVKETLAGAIVEVLRQRRDESWEIIGTAEAKGPSVSVRLNATLTTGERLRPRQRICDVQTERSPVATVVKPPPLPPDLRNPTNGKEVARNVPVTLSWTDPGAVEDRKADTFTVKVSRGGTAVPVTSPGSSANAIVAANDTAVFGASFTWSVTATNSTGSATSQSFSFRTPVAKPPVVAASQDGEKVKITGTGFAAGHAVEIELTTDYAQLQGGSQNPVSVIDWRQGTSVTTAKADGTIDVTVVAAEVLDPRSLVVNGTTQSEKASPYKESLVTVRGRNKPPIAAADGSPDWSATAQIASWA